MTTTMPGTYHAAAAGHAAKQGRRGGAEWSGWRARAICPCILAADKERRRAAAALGRRLPAVCKCEPRRASERAALLSPLCVVTNACMPHARRLSTATRHAGPLITVA